MAKFQEICVFGKANAKLAKSLLRIALEFGQVANLSIFELKVSGFGSKFFDEIEPKKFFICREPRNFLPSVLSRNTLSLPTIKVKGKITKESKDFLLSADVFGKLGGEVLSIIVREKSDKENKSYFLPERKYYGKRCWFKVSTDYTLSGNISIKKLSTLYTRLLRLDRPRLFFDPTQNVLIFRMDNSDKYFLDSISDDMHEIKSIADFIKLKSLTTIQVSNFTKRELSKIEKRNFERTILKLLRKARSNDSRNN